jgi:hypothetical protein
MPAKKSSPKSFSKKHMQYFFCVDAHNGQPLGFTIGSSAKTAGRATLELLQMLKTIYPDQGLALADTEHFTTEISNAFYGDGQFDPDRSGPMPQTTKVKGIMKELDYQRKWAGYALGETTYQFNGSQHPIRLIAQRSGEVESEYEYKPFAATGKRDALQMLSQDYPEGSGR